MSKPRSLAAACSLLLLSAAVYAHAAGGAATASKASSAAAKPAVTPIIDWLEAQAGIKVAAVPSKPAAVGIAAAGTTQQQQQQQDDTAAAAAAATSSYSAYSGKHREVCFSETLRCGSFGYSEETALGSTYIRAQGYYMSYFECCNKPYKSQSNEYSRNGLDLDDLPFGMGLTDRRQSAVGSCMIDIFDTDVPVSTRAASQVTVGHAQMTCDISDAQQCGIEDCNGATITMGVGKAYAVKQAISFEGAGLPNTCSELESLRRQQEVARGKGLGTPTAAAAATATTQSIAAAASNATKPAASASVSTAAAERTVCVGPAVVVSAPVALSSRTGSTQYNSGYVTYETFAYGREDGPEQVDCGVPFSSVEGLGLPVIDPNTFNFILN